MAQEIGYQRQTGTSAPVGLPSASPAAFGAAIGAASDELAQAVGRNQLVHTQIEREQRRSDEWADFQARFAQLRLDADTAETDARSTMAPGGAGYAQGRAQWLEGRTADLVNGITDNNVRRQAQSQLADFAGRQASQAYAVEAGARIAKRTIDVQSLIDISANRVNRDPATYKDENLALLPGIEELGDVPADVRDKLHRLAEEKLAIAVVTGTTRDNPRAAQAMIASGAFDKILSPEQVDQLRTRGEVAIHKLEIAQEREVAKVQAVEKEQEATLLKQWSDGVELDPVQLARAAGQAKARGDESRAYELTTAASAARLTAPFSAANADQLTRAMGKIEADEGWRKDPVKVAQHGWLEKRRTEIRQADPSIAAPQWSDPGSIAGFEQAIRADAADRGAEPQYLTRDMVDQFKPMLATVPGRMEALDRLHRMSPEAAVSAARQIAPDDRAFQGAALLIEPVRRMVVSGVEILKSKTSPVTDGKTRPIFQRFASRALKAFAGDTSAMVGETASAIAAELASRRGATSVSEPLYLEALHLALGGASRGGQPTGGLGYWTNGGGRGVRLILPTGMTQREFDTSIARINRPINAWWGNRQITASELRDNFTPVAVGDGVYEWEDAQGRAVKARDGSDARLVLRGAR